MLNITNYNEHPTRKAYTIFHFFNPERATYFENLLKEQQIWHESDVEETPSKTTYFYGVKNSDFKKVQQLNYLVNAKFRKPTIPFKPLRIAVYLVAIAVLTLAIIGFFKT
ncbi:MAG: hypothetical protein HYU68_00590 [Bacteroidetes bacterium]|nr:hypothetical protein [Bacteroidota bacterium]